MLSYYTVQPASVMRQHVQIIPDGPGVYALLLDDPEALEPALRRAGLRLDPLRLGERAVLYLGASEDSLRRRLKCHLSDDTFRSNFRMTLGAVLAEELGLEVRRPQAGRRFSFEPTSEAILSAWIGRNISVAIRESGHALVEEKTLIALNDPLLNIAGRRHQPSVETVVLLRRKLQGLPLDRRGFH